MSLFSTTPNKSYYSHIPKDLTTASAAQLVSDDSRLQWDAAYDLKSKQTIFLETTLTANANLDTELTPNRFLIWIIKQDTIGGWTPTFAPNPDSSLKFAGLSVVAPWVTTLNTYTALIFWVISPTKAYLVGNIGGGNLV